MKIAFHILFLIILICHIEVNAISSGAASHVNLHKLFNQLSVECRSDKDCADEDGDLRDDDDDDGPTKCCSRYGHCGYGQEFCGIGCRTDFDCPHSQCCSEFGNCGSGPEYCPWNDEECKEDPDDDLKDDDDSTCCSIDKDCADGDLKLNDDDDDDLPPKCCSHYSYCGWGPEFCGIQCNSDYECPASGCCSEFKNCGSGPEYCAKPTTKIPNSTPKPSPDQCRTDYDCLPGQCCSEYGHCGTGPEYCKCLSDNDCPIGQCCSAYGHCGAGPEFCVER